MKSPDLLSVMIAGMLGAVILVTIGYLGLSPTVTGASAPTVSGTALTGFAVGAGVQVGVRLIGVS